ncbi:tyrosine-type recombinase/integrase [Catenovulum adriaticum]|uniref:Site-specific integrase n=1 Tax=Catenovulum adriaticum TaxID=2984846 RepID=A0ABY7AJ56_9ALTE|nr:site-specific integrase [Catenovulum sp. TS8]WAJ69539.1 site-specific integrase [Catenovulum sp. TS8]
MAELSHLNVHQLYTIDYPTACQLQQKLLDMDYSARSINRAFVALFGVVKVAVLSGLVSNKQLQKLKTIKRVKHGEHRGRILTQANISGLFEFLNSTNSIVYKRDALIFALLLGAGFRRSELCALQVEDCNLDEQTVFIRKGKGNKSRITYLPDWVMPYLYCWININSLTTGTLIYSANHNGKSRLPLDGSSIYRIIKRRLASIQVYSVTPHDLRRTYITRLLEQKVDLNTVRKMAGHADVSTTIVYDKRSEQVMKVAAKALDYSKEV